VTRPPDVGGRFSHSTTVCECNRRTDRQNYYSTISRLHTLPRGRNRCCLGTMTFLAAVSTPILARLLVTTHDKKPTANVQNSAQNTSYFSVASYCSLVNSVCCSSAVSAVDNPRSSGDHSVHNGQPWRPCHIELLGDRLPISRVRDAVLYMYCLPAQCARSGLTSGCTQMYSSRKKLCNSNRQNYVHFYNYVPIQIIYPLVFTARAMLALQALY